MNRNTTMYWVFAVLNAHQPVFDIQAGLKFNRFSDSVLHLTYQYMNYVFFVKLWEIIGI